MKASEARARESRAWRIGISLPAGLRGCCQSAGTRLTCLPMSGSVGWQEIHEVLEKPRVILQRHALHPLSLEMEGTIFALRIRASPLVDAALLHAFGRTQVVQSVRKTL